MRTRAATLAADALAQVPRDGVLLLDKPRGISSFAALARARRALRLGRAGHTGTLDPEATGLLLACFGEATKFAGRMLDADKRYLATARLGVTTATGDAEGAVTRVRPVGDVKDTIAQVLQSFRGEISQVPPMYSALKHEGRPLYAYAREGKDIARPARRVSILQLEQTDMRPGPDGTVDLELDVLCSKGTYIRTLAEDIGEALGCGAHLAGLRRTQIGPFRVGDALTLDSLEQGSTPTLLAPDRLVSDLPAVILGADALLKYCQGQKVPVGESVVPGMSRVYGPEGRFLGLGEALPDGALQPRRQVLEPDA
jgi:tRNA pseudouridine55 synthase